MGKILFTAILPAIICLASCSGFDSRNGSAQGPDGNNPFFISTPEATIFYNVNIHIDFRENFLLSKYDVDFYIDGQMKNTLMHGKNQDYTLSLGNFEHTFVFAKNGDPSIFTEAKMDVTQSVAVSYKIQTHSTTIDVELTSIRNLGNSSDGGSAASTSVTGSPNSSGAEPDSSTAGNGWYDKEYTLTNNKFGHSGELDIVIDDWGITAQTIFIQGSITQTVVSKMSFTFFERATLYYDKQLGYDECGISQEGDVSVTAYQNSKVTFSLSYFSPTNLIDCVGVTGLEISGSYGATVDGTYWSERMEFDLEFTYQ